MLTTAESAVARIAYLSSDTIISVQGALGKQSEYSGQFEKLASANVSSLVSEAGDGLPEIQVIRQNADPLLAAHEPLRAGRLVSVTSTSSILIPSIPHLYRLTNYPVVIHTSMQPAEFPDFAEISSIRQCGWIMLQSNTLQEAQDIAIVAHALAIHTGKAVLHFFASTSGCDSIATENQNLLNQILDRGKIRLIRERKVESTNIYSDDGVIAQVSTNSVYTADSGISTGVTTPSSNGRSTGLAGLLNGLAGSSRFIIGSSEAAEGASNGHPSASSASSAHSTNIIRPITPDDIYIYAEQLFDAIRQVTSRKYHVFEYSGPPNADAALFIFGSTTDLFRKTVGQADAVIEGYSSVGIIFARLYRPWFGTKLAEKIPRSISKVAVLEQAKRKTTKWGPLFLDLLTCLRAEPTSGFSKTVVGYQLGYLTPSTIKQALRGVVQNLRSTSPVQNLQVGLSNPEQKPISESLSQPEAEVAYLKILHNLFGDRLHVANSIKESHPGLSEVIAASPEFGYGSLLAGLEEREVFTKDVEAAAKGYDISNQTTKELLAKWLAVADDANKCSPIADKLVYELSADSSALAEDLLRRKSHFYKESQWLIGSDAWAYDLGNSGVHHVLASGKNINMLIIDSQPYSVKAAADATRRKKDIGLYAMNFGNAYVASVAIYSSYTQVLHAIIDADKFNGPSVVMAYLPYNNESDSPLLMLQETKKAVDIGYWPLYRWDPYGDEKGESNFNLDSERIKTELKEFLKRDNHLTLLVRRNPAFASNLASSYGTEVRSEQKRKAKDAYAKLLEGVSGPPLTILFASDGGNAESLAKRLARRGKARGLKTIVIAMDDYPFEDLASEQNVAFITSTAGQGELPQNGRSFWETLKNSTDVDLAGVSYAVFGLGDSHYWPRKEDRIYYNKPCKDLDNRLAVVGGKRLLDVGLGDDQDPDGYQTGYSEWEPKLWASLGVDKVEGLADEPPPITNEDLKLASNYLRGTIKEGLEDESTGAISASDQQLTKFHGTYMQDDRDVRDERKGQGLEPAYSFMIRCRLPGGVATPEQWIRMDDISDTYGNHTMKLTTRQTFQFHGVLKRNLRNSMRAINKALMTTIAACGDINRNVMCSSLPEHSAYHSEVHSYAKLISDHLLPSTTAYHEIWIADDNDVKTQVAGNAVTDHEPLYGPTYLPRKFKITIAIPPHNDTDVYAHDLGLIAIKGDDRRLAGFNILIGGGMGVTHNNKKTYPRTGSMLGYCPKELVHLACEKIMLVQRDHGDRKNRKHARLKYTVDDMGIETYKGKVEELLKYTFEEPRQFHFDSNIDTFGWQKDEDGMNHFTFFIENGRVEDTPTFSMKTGLRALASLNVGQFRLTANQHLILSKIPDSELLRIKDLLAKYQLDNTNFSGLRLSSSACVAFPTCGLAMAESERYLPKLIDKLESTIEEAGLRHDSIVMRMTGCPNGCARPWLAEVAFVGKAYGAYNMYLGGGYYGQRINKLYRSSIREDEILEIMKPLIKRYAQERLEGERFGDFCIRSGIIKPTTEGRKFHEDVAEEDVE